MAIDTTRNIAAVSNFGCGSISLVDLTPGATAPLTKTIAVGTSPIGIDVIPRLGYAVVANNGSGTASIVNMDTATLVSSPGTGTNPTGVAIDQYSGLAIVTNTGSNSISSIDLTSITSANTTPTVNTLGIDQQPLAVAIDPNRAACGSATATGIGVAVITALQLSAGSSLGALDTVDISSAVPVQCTTVTPASVTATPTGIVFDPAGQAAGTSASSAPGTTPGVFYATGSQGNVIYVFNPDTGTATPCQRRHQSHVSCGELQHRNPVDRKLAQQHHFGVGYADAENSRHLGHWGLHPVRCGHSSAHQHGGDHRSGQQSSDHHATAKLVEQVSETSESRGSNSRRRGLSSKGNASAAKCIPANSMPPNVIVVSRGAIAVGSTMLSDCRGPRGSAILQSLCDARVTRREAVRANRDSLTSNC